MRLVVVDKVPLIVGMADDAEGGSAACSRIDLGRREERTNRQMFLGTWKLVGQARKYGGIRMEVPKGKTKVEVGWEENVRWKLEKGKIKVEEMDSGWRLGRGKDKGGEEEEKEEGVEEREAREDRKYREDWCRKGREERMKWAVANIQHWSIAQHAIAIVLEREGIDGVGIIEHYARQRIP